MSEESRLKSLEDKLEALTKDYNQALEALNEQITENETLKAGGTSWESEKAALTDKVRNLTARQAFDKVAEELKIRPELRDDAWKLGEFKADKDEVDPKALKDHFGKFLENRKHYTGEPEPPKRIAKGEGSDRGGSTESDPRPKVTREQLSDPEWCFQNKPKLAKAISEGYMPMEVGAN